MDSLATTLLFAVILLGQVRLFCGVILRKCVNIHTTLSDIVILPPWVILLTYIILRVRVFSSTDIRIINPYIFLIIHGRNQGYSLRSKGVNSSRPGEPYLSPLPESPLVQVMAWCLFDKFRSHIHINGLVQDCSNSIANALELLQSCAKPSIYGTSTWRVNIIRSYRNMLIINTLFSVPVVNWKFAV